MDGVGWGGVRRGGAGMDGMDGLDGVAGMDSGGFGRVRGFLGLGGGGAEGDGYFLTNRPQREQSGVQVT